MQLITNIKRWMNSWNVKYITYESFGLNEIKEVEYASLKASHRGYPIGIIKISYSTYIDYVGRKLPELLKGNSFIIINDIYLYKDSWKLIGIGRKLVEKSVTELKSVLPTDTWVTGLITDVEVIGFWKKLGFQYIENDNGCFILCKLSEIKV